MKVAQRGSCPLITTKRENECERVKKKGYIFKAIVVTFTRKIVTKTGKKRRKKQDNTKRKCKGMLGKYLVTTI